MLHEAPLSEIADDLRRGRTDVGTYVETIESRAEEVEPTIESLVPEEGRWERLREAAAELDDDETDVSDRPPLYGVPIGVKDIFHVEGLPTRAGSNVPPEALDGPEATVVSRLRDAGALVVGKTVTTEFAYLEPGPTRNPHDPDHTPGGSSSGSAAAVAAGLCPFAFGTQTIGSVIRPASFCGVVGFKPTYGRIPIGGVIPLSKSVDHVGFFTQDVAGVALVAPLLYDEWRTLPHSEGRPTLGVPEGPYLQQATETGLDAFEEQLARLEAAGYEIERVEAFENVDEVNERHENLVAADAALAHDEWYDQYSEKYRPGTAELIEDGRAVSTAELAEGRRGRDQLRAALEGLMAEHGIDAWIAPAAPGPAPEGIDSTGDPNMNLPWTHAGLPTISLPAGKTDDGLPLGVQCAAAFGADEDLVLWAHELAEAL
jgi:Asp-tRNA(Asn)/Glu-tRNA(Gln) amidotransferase A subunit family amidase